MLFSLILDVPIPVERHYAFVIRRVHCAFACFVLPACAEEKGSNDRSSEPDQTLVSRESDSMDCLKITSLHCRSSTHKA